MSLEPAAPTLSGDGIILLTYTMSGPLASQFLIDVAYRSSSGPCAQANAVRAKSNARNKTLCSPCSAFDVSQSRGHSRSYAVPAVIAVMCHCYRSSWWLV